MKDLPNCIKCGSEFTYEDRDLYVCPECSHEWGGDVVFQDDKQKIMVKDAYGNILEDGDSVTIIKDIKVKGMSLAIKVGVKVKNIRLIDEVNGHNFEGKVPGFGLMLLKSELVKKTN